MTHNLNAEKIGRTKCGATTCDDVTRPIWDEATHVYRRVNLHPVKEDFLTQVGPGSECFYANSLIAGDVMLIEQRNPPLAVGGAVMMPEHFAILVPLSWKGEYRISGQTIGPNSVFVTSRPSGFVSRGEGRVLVAVALPRAPLQHVLAALRGISPDEVELPDGILELPTAAISLLRTSLPKIMSGNVADRNKTAHIAEVRERVLGELLDACLLVGRQAVPHPCRLSHPERIVRRAEDRFAEAQWGKISLGDLCIAAGTSQSGLYMAFQDLYGEPPLRYFYRRRLNRAREILLGAKLDRGLVQQTALDVGLTEFGRFSRDYKMLFGELPSATLSATTSTYDV